MLYESHEVEHTGLPIFDKINNEQYTIELIVSSRLPIEEFLRVGFVKIRKYKRDVYIPIYEKR